MTTPFSFSRQRPTASKFSSARPMPSTRSWQPAQVGFSRCTATRSRIVGAVLEGGSSVTTSSGGGGIDVQRKRSSTNMPRWVTEVLSACDWLARMEAWLRMPLRPCSSGNEAWVQGSSGADTW